MHTQYFHIGERHSIQIQWPLLVLFVWITQYGVDEFLFKFIVFWLNRHALTNSIYLQSIFWTNADAMSGSGTLEYFIGLFHLSTTFRWKKKSFPKCIFCTQQKQQQQKHFLMTLHCNVPWSVWCEVMTD